jgi:4-hydroxybenzoate polyprenyltransferase
MRRILDFMQMIRWLNLLILGMTMCFFRCFFILSSFSYAGYTSELPDKGFYLLLLATLLIAAAGNIVNDIFDVDTDRINRPDRPMVRGAFSEQFMMNAYYGLNAVALICAGWVCYRTGRMSVFPIFIFSIAMLWIYTQYFKKIMLLGNLVIAILSALPIWILILFEKSLFHPSADITMYKLAYMLLIYGAVYSLFALLITFIRELVKDMEDVDGDQLTGANTLAVRFGSAIAARGAQFLLLISSSGLLKIAYTYYQAGLKIQMAYVMILLVLPLLAILFFLFKVPSKKGLGRISFILKLVMLFGIITLPVFYLLNK